MRKAHQSKYDPYFNIDHVLKKAACKLCTDVISKNCFGMARHLRTKHDVVAEEISNNEDENVQDESPSKKAKVSADEIEPIEDQICREVAKEGASFR